MGPDGEFTKDDDVHQRTCRQDQNGRDDKVLGSRLSPTPLSRRILTKLRKSVEVRKSFVVSSEVCEGSILVYISPIALIAMFVISATGVDGFWDTPCFFNYFVRKKRIRTQGKDNRRNIWMMDSTNCPEGCHPSKYYDVKVKKDCRDDPEQDSSQGY
jgi:hypothetical protein